MSKSKYVSEVFVDTPEEVKKKLEKLGIEPVKLFSASGQIRTYTEIAFRNEEDRKLYIQTYGI